MATKSGSFLPTRRYHGDTMQGSKKEVRDGTWRLRVYTGQRRANGSPIFNTKTVKAPGKNPKPGAGARVADAELAKMVAEVAKGNTAAGTDTVDTLLDKWLADCQNRLQPTTVAKYHQIANRDVRPALGKIKLTKLTVGHLERLYDDLTARGNKPRTVQRVKALISAALNFAERWNMVSRNVAKVAKAPTVHKSKGVTVPTIEAVQAMVRKADDEDLTAGAYLRLAILTTARRGELCALRWSDVESEVGTIHIARSLYERKGGGWAEKDTKTHQERTIVLDAFGRDVLRWHREDVERDAAQFELEVLPDGFVFSSEVDGSEPIRPEVATRYVERFGKPNGVTHLHALRHFGASQLMAAGIDAVTVAKRLGHSSTQITLDTYGHSTAERDKAAAEALGSILESPAALSAST
jgi:integrase